MFLVQKIKTYHSFIISALFHMLILAAIFNIFSNKADLNNIVEINPVAIISGSQFAKITKSFNRNDDSSSFQTSQLRKGSNKSAMINGVISNLAPKKSDNYDNSYLNLVAHKIEQHKSYISMFSAPSGIKSEVIFKVKLDESGELDSYKMVQSSNYGFFNKAAIKILKISSPFPKPPLKNGSRSAELTIPIVFDTIS
jgi:TonB family protein